MVSIFTQPLKQLFTRLHTEEQWPDSMREEVSMGEELSCQVFSSLRRPSTAPSLPSLSNPTDCRAMATTARTDDTRTRSCYYEVKDARWHRRARTPRREGQQFLASPRGTATPVALVRVDSSRVDEGMRVCVPLDNEISVLQRGCGGL